MLAATGCTQLLVNLENMTTKPNAGGSITWKVEKAMHIQTRSPRILLQIWMVSQTGSKTACCSARVALSHHSNNKSPDRYDNIMLSFANMGILNPIAMVGV